MQPRKKKTINESRTRVVRGFRLWGMAETKASLALSCAVLMLSLHRMAVSTSPKLQVVTSGPSHYSRAWPPAAALYLRGGSSLAAANETSPLARCGSATADADTSHLPPDPKAWELAHVLEFLQQLHPTLKDRTDQYKQLFIDNDIDGVILLGLTTDKLEKACAAPRAMASARSQLFLIDVRN
jgi:hypothetical protein